MIFWISIIKPSSSVTPVTLASWGAQPDPPVPAHCWRGKDADKQLTATCTSWSPCAHLQLRHGQNVWHKPCIYFPTCLNCKSPQAAPVGPTIPCYIQSVWLSPHPLTQLLTSCQLALLFKEMLVVCLLCKHYQGGQDFHWKRSRAFSWGKNGIDFLRYFGWWLEFRAKSQHCYPCETSYTDECLSAASWNSRKKLRKPQMSHFKIYLFRFWTQVSFLFFFFLILPKQLKFGNATYLSGFMGRKIMELNSKLAFTTVTAFLNKY